MEQDKSVGGFLRLTFGLISTNIAAVALYIFVLSALNIAGVFFELVDPSDRIAGFSMGFSLSAEDEIISSIFTIIAAIVGVVATYFLLAQYLASQGRLKSTETRIWAYIGMSIVAFLGYMLGFLLLIVPGIIIMVRWSASSGFLIGERFGIGDSLKASWDATSGHSWPIFGAGLVLLIGFVVIFGGLGFLLGSIDEMFAVAAAAVIADTLSNALFLAFGIAIYCIVHDGADETAEVFA